MFLGPFAATPAPLCLRPSTCCLESECTRLWADTLTNSTSSLASPFSVLLLRHPKLPSLQPCSYYLFQDDGLADISYSSGPLMSLKKILGRPGPPKSKSHLRMSPPQTQTFFPKAFSGLLLLSQGHKEAGLGNQVCWDSGLIVSASEAPSVRTLSYIRQAQVWFVQVTTEGLAPWRQEVTPVESRHGWDPELSILSGMQPSRLLYPAWGDPHLKPRFKEEGQGLEY